MILSPFWDAGNVLIFAVAVSLCGAIGVSASRWLRGRDLSVAAKAVLPLEEPPPGDAPVKPGNVPRKRMRPFANIPPEPARPRPRKASRYLREHLEDILSLIAIAGDFTMIVGGFVLAGLLCRNDFVSALLKCQPMPSLTDSYRIILFASVIALWGLVGRSLYHYRSLLFPSKIWHKFFEALGFCLLASMCIGLVVKTDPPIPWTFFAGAIIIIFLGIYNWRMVLRRLLRLPVFSSRLRRRLVVIGGGSQTRRIQHALGEHSDLEFVGWVQANKPNHVRELDRFRLGSLHELEDILRQYAINIAVLTESESLQREGVLAVAKACENEYVQFKMVPHFFEILISGLRAENIGGIQLLGVDSLPLSGYRNRFLKRTVDIIGALVGLGLTLPLMVFFGTLVYRESPGPILYKQLRQGRNGRVFHIYKIRSMHMNAEVAGKAQWTQQNDNRRLRIGTFMRKWNIDEVPQFWNVLVGQMSLVGPRPERPELIVRFKSKIPHYQARHIYQPGITGWAQVNGWRGNTDLEERIRHDIWYLENWSIWLDFRIMLQTFYRRQNAY